MKHNSINTVRAVTYKQSLAFLALFSIILFFLVQVSSAYAAIGYLYQYVTCQSDTGCPPPTGIQIEGAYQAGHQNPQVRMGCYDIGYTVRYYDNFEEPDPALKNMYACYEYYNAEGSIYDFDGAGQIMTFYYGPETPPPPTVDLKINNNDGPVTVNAGQPFTLTWSTTNTSSCIKNGNNWGSMAVAVLNNSTGDSVTLSTAGSYTYALSCNGITDSVDITVQGPPAGQCTATPNSINIGSASTWSTSNVTGGNGSYTYSWSGTDALSGTGSSVNKIYNTAGTKSASVAITSAGQTTNVSCANTITVIDPPPAAPTGGTATPGSCGTNQLVLSWSSVTNATSYSIYSSTGTWIGNSIGSNYTFTGTAGQTYTFYVRANSATGVQSANSATFSGAVANACSYSCTGSVPSGAQAYDAEESSSLSGNTLWTYSASDTATKCQYACYSGYTWNGVSCVANPTAAITVPNCSIAAGASSCTTNVAWSSANTINPLSVRQNSTEFSAAASSGGTARTLTYGSNTFTFHHSGGIQLSAASATASCAGGTTWSGTSCATAPTIDLRVDGVNGPLSVNTNGVATLSWTTLNSPTSCIASGDWNGSKAVGGGSEVVNVGTSNKTYTLICTNAGGSSVDSVSISISTTPPNQPVTTVGACTINDANTSVTVQGTDPQAQTVAYQVDWDNNGIPDQAIPGAGYVTSGTSQAITRTFTAASNPFQVRTVTSDGRVSAWKAESASCVNPPPKTIDLKINGSDGPLSVHSGQVLTLTWTSNNGPTNCTKWGSGWGSGTAIANQNVTGDTVTISGAGDTYGIFCDGGISDSIVVSVIPPPPPPSSITATCPAPGTALSVNWSSVSGATSYSYRVDNQSNPWTGACPATNSGDACQDGYGATSVNLTGIPGSNFNAWVHACNSSGCSAPIAVTAPVSCVQYPNLNQPNVTYTLSPGFNPATGYYDYIDVTFQTTNNGGSDTQANANYEFQFDRGRDGYEHTVVGSLGTLTVGQAVNRTERVSGNIPFGNARIRVYIDNTNAVTETDEGDNTRILDLTIPPPNPNLNLVADRYQVRNGETVTLTWSVGIPYAMNCRVYGPGMDVNPSGVSGTRVTQAIVAKSEYTFTCTEPNTNTTFTDTITVETQGEIEEI